MEITFRALSEPQPGPKWAGLFAEYWPAYRRWWASQGERARPTYTRCHAALREHMPEIVPLYETLCEWAGGGDREARFLSNYCPPAYATACSQAIWPGAEPVLVRNYDYIAQAFDAVTLHTEWQGRKVVGTSDGLFGLVDGMNDAGLAISLTFGGRQIVGDGFGVPLILRYILQTCDTADEASAVLKRIPCHMSYNVTVLDARRRYATAYMSPDRGTVLTHAAVATNHQEKVEWDTHARFTATVERERFLLHRLALHKDTEQKFVGAFLKPPLYSTAFDKGFGTLYTALYRPRLGEMELRWPNSAWPLSINGFTDATWRVKVPLAA